MRMVMGISIFITSGPRPNNSALRLNLRTAHLSPAAGPNNAAAELEDDVEEEGAGARVSLEAVVMETSCPRSFLVQMGFVVMALL